MSDKYRINEKLTVRPITLDDTEQVVAWRQNPRVINNFLYRGPFTAEIHNEWMRTRVASGEVIQFIVEEQLETGTRGIGSVYYRDVDMDERTAEYGIFLGEDDAVGQGYGSAIAAWAVDYARDELKLKTLRLRALADNTAAVRSYEKAGYRTYDRTEGYIDGRDLLFMKVDF